MTKLSRLWHPGSVCAKQTLHNKTLFISLSLWANLRYFTARINASWHFFSNFEFLLVVNSIINPSSSTQICILTVTCQWRKTKGVKHLASNSKLNQPDQTFSVSSPGHWLEPSPSPSWVAHRRPVWEMVKVVISNSICIGWSWVDIMNCRNWDMSYQPKPKAEAGNPDMRFENAWYHAKAELNNCISIHFLNNMQKKTFSDFAKVREQYKDEGLGN